MTNLTTTEALELAGKAEITRLHDRIETAYDALVDGRKGDALKILQIEVKNRKAVCQIPSLVGNSIA